MYCSIDGSRSSTAYNIVFAVVLKINAPQVGPVGVFSGQFTLGLRDMIPGIILIPSEHCNAIITTEFCGQELASLQQQKG